VRFRRTDQNTKTEPKETRSMTTDTATPTTETPPPALYGAGDTWAEDTSSTFYVKPSLRTAYAAAVTDTETLGRITHEAAEGKRGRYRWVPLAEAERMRDAGEVLTQWAEEVSEDQKHVQVKVRVSGADAVHAVRLRQATDAVEHARRQAELREQSTSPCAGCGVGLRGTQRKSPDHALVDWGIVPAGAVLCARCLVALPTAVAAETLPDGRTRGAALAALVGRQAIERVAAVDPQAVGKNRVR
jgi:hypothetical protein